MEIKSVTGKRKFNFEGANFSGGVVDTSRLNFDLSDSNDGKTVGFKVIFSIDADWESGTYMHYEQDVVAEIPAFEYEKDPIRLLKLITLQLQSKLYSNLEESQFFPLLGLEKYIPGISAEHESTFNRLVFDFDNRRGK